MQLTPEQIRRAAVAVRDHLLAGRPPIVPAELSEMLATCRLALANNTHRHGG